MQIDDLINFTKQLQIDKRRTLNIFLKDKVKSCLNVCLLVNNDLVITELETYKQIKPNASIQKIGYLSLKLLYRLQAANYNRIYFFTGSKEDFSKENFFKGFLSHFNNYNELILIKE